MKRFFIFSIIFAFAALILALSWQVSGFSDLYVKYVFPILATNYGRLAALAPISVGEILLYVFAGLGALAVLFFVLGLLLILFGKRKPLWFALGFGRVFLDICVIVFLIQVLNCFVLYHTTPIYGEDPVYTPTREELVELREVLVGRANDLSLTFERNEKGEIVYNGDMAETAREAMKRLGEIGDYSLSAEDAPKALKKLSRLKGFYSNPKPLWLSGFFSQQYIKGYFFPFSMEANYNDVMYIANIPDTLCHELSHTKGFIYEDEASFIAYLACMNSGDPFFEYSATLNALDYVNEEIYKEIERDPSLYDRITKKNELVIRDCVFLTDEAWAKVEKDSLLDTDMVSQASETFLDTNLTVNGVEDGIVSYSRMVNLLLRYHSELMPASVDPESEESETAEGSAAGGTEN
ncbi:MAG: DUF3810 domain-containing protein [Lachnospiraceae bacterium]|nr:DUF3810 domain-containing protein [Lachnospiraceae bacterium]